ncbi:MAG: disulfide bond formation protein B [Burkholderiaceae bacterium]|nr:disulfide bond formation protein B [Burkholderiaceae bacterium]MCD8518026.1 disulfide bond formation protein B [Burkholderiaceae bacterium]MCD8537328.1 disulfide bond formation protein B [Burkholderiaceae bacterium]MCD8564349.1 disulfide bond formation protein B [Burkholderiaceae bacterium]
MSQHLLGMLPCAWCIFQRLLFILIAVVAFLGAMVDHRVVRRTALIITLLLSVAGIAAAWHQWTVAAESFSCDQTLADRIVVGSGLDAALPWLFGIYATCMDAAVSVLGLDFAVWSLLLYAVFAVASLVALRTSKMN